MHVRQAIHLFDIREIAEAGNNKKKKQIKKFDGSRLNGNNRSQVVLLHIAR